ncbi:type I-E CRISPR-associated protein Cas6/Cse3/CasE [Streptomyces sp. NPDC097619]|uniref:type I-E CRISPR-associated protein Cas6/Cse3/CasE n=1 Tax=Streptomyces sp. NPDC097619 TaxID=3157228 RepID=UPI003325E4FE
MYLTRLPLNSARADARRLLGSPHRMHGAVCMSFPEAPARDGQGPRVLWRTDVNAAGRTDLFIVSPTRPDLTHLVEQAGWPTLEEPGWTTFAYGEFLDGLAEGDTWGFRLTANPVHYVRKADDPKGAETKRTAHVTPRHQLGWLLKKQEQAGFEVVRKPAERQHTEYDDEYQIVLHDRTPQQFGKRSEGGPRRQVSITRVTYDGLLRITDLPSFRRTLTQGLGKAKAYGCGLMTLAPVR